MQPISYIVLNAGQFAQESRWRDPDVSHDVQSDNQNFLDPISACFQ